MSTNWKLIGKNSGNMSQYRNVTHNKLNYETGKLNSIYDVSGIPTKGYTFDICGENIVLGVGTDKPFSRLSLGNNTDSGKFNANKPGQLSAIALDESGTGNSFTGIVLNSDITTLDGNPTKGIQIMSSTSDFSMNDTTNTGKIILSNENVTTIGGNSRGKPFGYSPNSTRDIVLDVRGSIRTDGYINFYDVVSTSVPITTVPAGSEWTTTNTGDVPRGSLFLTSGGDGTPEGLWFKNKAGGVEQITGGSSSGGVGTGSSFDICGTGTDSFIVARNAAVGTLYGGTPVTFSGKTWAPTVINNNNAVTIRDGNLAVITPSGDYLKVISPTLNAESHFTDNSGGIILAQKQLLIGAPSPTSPSDRFGYGLIDVQSVEKVPTLQGYNNPGESSFRPTAATNSIILLTKEEGHNGHSNGVSEIGNIYDCSNTIIIGGSNFSQIDTPNSIISINPDLETNKTKIIDISGSNLVFGANNDLSGSPFSIIFGTDNKIDNTEKAGLEGKENVVLGSTNNLYNSQNSLVQGTGNINYGNLNVIFGKDNKIGNVFNDPAYYKYSGSNCFIQGSKNEIKAKYHVSVNTVNNAFIAGYKNILDCSYALFSQNPNSSYILLGSSASIKEDISNVRLAFGTKEMEGNVFTIDMSGNTHIFGDLTVDDNNLSLNFGNTSAPNGGGITLIDTTGGNKGLIWNENGGPVGNGNYWDTSGSDMSMNNLFANNIISNDISANDISCVDISAVNFFSIGSSFFGDVHATRASSFNDISATDISCVDISANSVTIVGDTLYVDGKAFTFPSSSGILTTTTSGGGVAIANNIAGGLLGSIPYQNANNDTEMLDANTTTTTKFLSQTGAVPSWSTVTRSHVGLSDVTNESKSTMFTSPTFTGNIFLQGDISGHDASFNDLSLNYLYVHHDISANNIYLQGDISGNDASFNDLSLNYLYVHHDISANNIFLQGDISGHDASFNDLSLNYLYVHNDISANNIFLQGDISCVDISCVDISASHFYPVGFTTTYDMSNNSDFDTSGLTTIADISTNLIYLIKHLRAIGIVPP